MAANQNFRTAFSGFNREDVVHYIEYLNSRHASEISELKSEMEYLQGKAELAAVPMNLSDENPEDNPLMEQQANRIRELFDQCQKQEQEIAALTAQRSALEQEIASLKAENERLTAEQAAASQPPVFHPRMEDELEAYRRAERTERLARERAEKIYQRTNGVLAEATAQVDSAADQIGGLTDQVLQQLQQLQTVVSGSKDALKDAAAVMYALRPTEE